MKKTGYEIIGMIKDGIAPKKIKYGTINYEFELTRKIYENKDGEAIDLIQCLDVGFEIVEEEQKVWKPPKCAVYYSIDIDGKICRFTWCNNKEDETRHSIGNCFETEEKAQKTLEKIKTYMKLKRYAEEHNTEKIDWRDGSQEKWSICFNIEKRAVIHLSFIKRNIFQVYFTDEETAMNAILEIGENNIKKLFTDEKDIFDILKEEDLEEI